MSLHPALGTASARTGFHVHTENSMDGLAELWHVIEEHKMHGYRITPSYRVRLTWARVSATARGISACA